MAAYRYKMPPKETMLGAWMTSLASSARQGVPEVDSLISNCSPAAFGLGSCSSCGLGESLFAATAVPGALSGHAGDFGISEK